MFLALLFCFSSCLILGGYEACPSFDNSKKVEVAMFAVRLVNKNSNSGSPFKLDSVEKCEKQIVAGVNWRLELKGSEDEVEWHKLINVYEDLSGKYHLSSSEDRVYAGGWQDCLSKCQNGEPDMIATLQKTSMKINEMSNSISPLSIVGVKSCQEQVVAGINYKMKVELKNTGDGNTEVHDIEVFEALDGSVQVTMVD